MCKRMYHFRQNSTGCLYDCNCTVSIQRDTSHASLVGDKNGNFVPQSWDSQILHNKSPNIFPKQDLQQKEEDFVQISPIICRDKKSTIPRTKIFFLQKNGPKNREEFIQNSPFFVPKYFNTQENTIPPSKIFPTKMLK